MLATNARGRVLMKVQHTPCKVRVNQSINNLSSKTKVPVCVCGWVGGRGVINVLVKVNVSFDIFC